MVHCFWLEEVGKVRRQFRRYAGEAKCPGIYGYHNGMAALDDIDWPAKATIESFTGEFAHSDPRWPTKCDHCDYVFQESDNWQIFTDRLYKRSDSGEIIALGDAPAGAMWDAYWMTERYKGQDGIHLCVKLPDGCHWLVDGPSSGGGPGWTRSGAPPVITARPSILTPKYHGFLTNGILISC